MLYSSENGLFITTVLYSRWSLSFINSSLKTSLSENGLLSAYYQLSNTNHLSGKAL